MPRIRKLICRGEKLTPLQLGELSQFSSREIQIFLDSCQGSLHEAVDSRFRSILESRKPKEGKVPKEKRKKKWPGQNPSATRLVLFFSQPLNDEMLDGVEFVEGHGIFAGLEGVESIRQSGCSDGFGEGEGMLSGVDHIEVV